MAYRPSNRRHLKPSSEDLNLTPIMNVFMIIIPFLLLTAVFAKTAIIDIYLPQEAGSSSATDTASEPQVLTVSVTDSGFELGGVGNGMVIPKVSDRYDFKQLSEELTKIKERYPEKEDIVLLIQQNLPYETVVKIMDTARETDGKERKPLFPLVSLGEAGT